MTQERVLNADERNAGETQVQDCVDLLKRLCGADPGSARGVIHVLSTVRGADGRLRVLRVGPRAPRSDSDFFLLNSCRARADALLTTAKILRDEPGLTHELQGPWRSALVEYRRERLRKRRTLTCAVLSRTGNLPLEHPVWSDGTTRIVFTDHSRRTSLQRQIGLRAEVVGLTNLDARGALTWLRAAGARTITVEAGPTAVAPLYGRPTLVDELVISRCEGVLEAEVVGGTLPADGDLFRGLIRSGHSVVEEHGRRWHFERWLRSQGSA